MFKPGRSEKGRGWGGNLSPAGDEAKLPVLGATVTAIEADRKRPHMYRVALQLELDDSAIEEAADQHTSHGLAESERMTVNWTDEVDALIAGARSKHGAGEALVTVHEDTLVSWRLLKGRQLSAEEYETLKQDEQKEEAYRSALMMLERKARTSAELAKALKRKGYVPEVVTACLERLQSRRMIDDAAYAKRFTEQRAVGQRKGRMLIRQELMQRGVERADVERAIGELDGQIEQDSALALARKRWPNIKGNDRERKQKLMGMLMRRGFPSGVVRTAVQQAAAESGAREMDPDEVEEYAYEPEDMED